MHLPSYYHDRGRIGIFYTLNYIIIRSHIEISWAHISMIFLSPCAPFTYNSLAYTYIWIMDTWFRVRILAHGVSVWMRYSYGTLDMMIGYLFTRDAIMPLFVLGVGSVHLELGDKPCYFGLYEYGRYIDLVPGRYMDHVSGYVDTCILYQSTLILYRLSMHSYYWLI